VHLLSDHAKAAHAVGWSLLELDEVRDTRTSGVVARDLDQLGIDVDTDTSGAMQPCCRYHDAAVSGAQVD